MKLFAGARRRGGVAADGRQLGDRAAGALGDRGDVGGELAQRRGSEAVLLVEHGEQQVLGEDLGVAELSREPLGGCDCLL